MASDDTGVEIKRRDIFNLAIICEDLFSKYADPEQSLPEPRARADLQQQRFDIWASYLGVFAPYDVSLDRRLEYSEEIRNLVVHLLSLMRKNLDFVSHDGESEKQSLLGSTILKGKDVHAATTLIGTASEALDTIEATIDRLNRLGSTIRKFSTASLETRVKAFTSQHGDENYPAFAKLIVKFRYMTAPTSLQEHLAVSMSSRRQRLRYMGRHQAKLAAREPTRSHKLEERGQVQIKKSARVRFVSIMEEEDADKPVESDLAQRDKKRGFRSLQNNPFIKGFAPSNVGSKASTFKPPPSVVARLRVDGGSVVSSSKNSKTFMAEDLENYPAAPTMEPGKPPPTCPYCHKPLEAAELEARKWHRHVNQDLQPFVCISENCSQPPQSFWDFEIWAKHMRESHSSKWTQQVHKPVIWRCDLYHTEEVFAEETKFEQHLTDEHSSATLTERKAISRSSRSTRKRRPHTCPFCGFNISLLDSTQPRSPFGTTRDSTNANEDEALHKLARHVASHLRLLAFTSADNLDAENDDSSRGSIKSLEMRSKDGSKTHPPSGIKDMSRGKLSFVDEGPEDVTLRILWVNQQDDTDPDWSSRERQDMEIAPEYDYPTEGLSWTKVKDILKTKLEPEILAELEHTDKEKDFDKPRHHIYQRQLLIWLREQNVEVESIAYAIIKFSWPEASSTIQQQVLEGCMISRARRLQKALIIDNTPAPIRFSREPVREAVELSPSPPPPPIFIHKAPIGVPVLIPPYQRYLGEDLKAEEFSSRRDPEKWDRYQDTPGRYSDPYDLVPSEGSARETLSRHPHHRFADAASHTKAPSEVISSYTEGTKSEIMRNLARSPDEKEGYPPFPRGRKCPFCLEDISNLMPLSWRSHVNQDLQPYVCIEVSCADTLRLFHSSKDMRKHMATSHPNAFDDLVCPICKVYIDQGEGGLTGDLKARVAKSALYRHIAAHLQSIALKLAQLSDGDPERSDQVGTSAEEIYRSQSGGSRDGLSDVTLENFEYETTHNFQYGDIPNEERRMASSNIDLDVPNVETDNLNDIWAFIQEQRAGEFDDPAKDRVLEHIRLLRGQF